MEVREEEKGGLEGSGEGAGTTWGRHGVKGSGGPWRDGVRGFERERRKREEEEGGGIQGEQKEE